jgi:O-antigen/teichoic acid export membrane protein
MVPGLPGRYGFRRSVFNETWRYTAGMIGITLVSTVLIQMDKIVVSKMMSLEDFGYYMLASVMAQAPIIIAAPISAAVFPRFTNLASEGARKSLAALYHRTCGLVSAVAIPCGLTLALFSGDFLLAWTGSATAADRAGLTACLLTGGSLCLALQVIPYNLALAYGWTRLNLYLGMASMVIIIPLLIILVGMLGLTGAGMSWMALNVLVIPPYIHYLHKRFLKGEVRRWYLKDIGLPLLAALPVVLIGRWLFPQFHSRPAIFITIGLVGSTAILAAFLAVPELRREIIRKTGRLLAGAHYGT